MIIFSGYHHQWPIGAIIGHGLRNSVHKIKNRENYWWLFYFLFLRKPFVLLLSKLFPLRLQVQLFHLFTGPWGSS